MTTDARHAALAALAALLLALAASAADPEIPERPERRPRVAWVVVGATLGAGAVGSAALSQVERSRWNAQKSTFTADPISLPWDEAERDRLRATDVTLRRHYAFGQAGAALGALGAGFVVVGVIGRRAGPSAPRDADGDGLIDGDACPLEPETINGHRDDDGCPDELARLVVRGRAFGAPREGVPFAVTGMGDSRVVDPGGGTVSGLIPGAYDVRSLDPFWDGNLQIRLREGDNTADVDLMEIVPGTLVVTARDDAGQPIADATATVAPRGGGAGTSVALDRSGYGEVRVAPGSWSIFVEAPTFGVRRQDAEVVAEQQTVVETTLRPAGTDLSASEIALRRPVLFRVGSAEIDERSNELLEEVANVLLRNSDLLRVEIRGHTSADGDAASNQRLSEERAAAVQRFLVAQGVAESRLVTVGFGQSRPLVPERSEADRAKNRRVEIVIVARR